MRNTWRFILGSKLLILSILLLSSCSKFKKLEKRLAGTWDIESLEFTNPNGLSYFYKAVGTLSYTPNSESTGSFVFNYTYYPGTDTVEVYESGNYDFHYGDTEFYDVIRIMGQTSDTIEKARVLLLTNTDLRTEMNEVSGRRSFVLKK